MCIYEVLPFQRRYRQRKYVQTMISKYVNTLYVSVSHIFPPRRATGSPVLLVLLPGSLLCSAAFRWERTAARMSEFDGRTGRSRWQKSSSTTIFAKRDVYFHAYYQSTVSSELLDLYVRYIHVDVYTVYYIYIYSIMYIIYYTLYIQYIYSFEFYGFGSSSIDLLSSVHPDISLRFFHFGVHEL